MLQGGGKEIRFPGKASSNPSDEKPKRISRDGQASNLRMMRLVLEILHRQSYTYKVGKRKRHHETAYKTSEDVDFKANIVAWMNIPERIVPD